MKTYMGPLLISINVLLAVSIHFAFVLWFGGVLAYSPFRALLPWAIMAGEIILIRKGRKAGAKFSKLTFWFAYIVLPFIGGLSLIVMYRFICEMCYWHIL
jgi:hypothetical protein